MLRHTLKHLMKTFDKRHDWIYVAGPFFNDVQKRWALTLASELRNRGYKIFAPVDEVYKENNGLKPEEIFKRNLDWMNHSKLSLIQLDFPFPPTEKLCLVSNHSCHDREDISFLTPLKVLSIPDSGTCFEIGYLFSKKIPMIGYYFSKQDSINLMLAQSLTGFCKPHILDIFLENKIIWNNITEWKGKQT